MKADALLAKLDKVRTLSNGGWVACCPAHEDRTPSLSIREEDDGRVLVHCFAGCSVQSIMQSVGMELSDLFPDKPPSDHAAKRFVKPFPAHNVLAALSTESLIVAVAAGNMAKGIELTEKDRARLMTAAARIQEGARLALGERG